MAGEKDVAGAAADAAKGIAGKVWNGAKWVFSQVAHPKHYMRNLGIGVSLAAIGGISAMSGGTVFIDPTNVTGLLTASKAKLTAGATAEAAKIGAWDATKAVAMDGLTYVYNGLGTIVKFGHHVITHAQLDAIGEGFTKLGSGIMGTAKTGAAGANPADIVKGGGGFIEAVKNTAGKVISAAKDSVPVDLHSFNLGLN